MAIEIDQSGKIEDTAKNTVIAFFDLKTETFGSIFLSGRDKRRLQEWFREHGIPKLFIDYVFSIILGILIKKFKLAKVVIDIEYFGHTEIINSLINDISAVDISWKLVGKSSKSHDIAYKVFTGKSAPSLKINAEIAEKMAKK